MRREEKVLKKLTVVCIQKDLTLGYTTPTLNLFNSYSFFNVKFTQFFFLNTKYFNTHRKNKKKY